MGRDVWVKEIMHFNKVCGGNKINTQLLFYDGHGSNFYDRAIHILRSNHTKPSILKAVDSGNDQPNDNGPILNLKEIYG